MGEYYNIGVWLAKVFSVIIMRHPVRRPQYDVVGTNQNYK
jgi:hypothetical protein